LVSHILKLSVVGMAGLGVLKSAVSLFKWAWEIVSRH